MEDVEKRRAPSIVILRPKAEESLFLLDGGDPSCLVALRMTGKPGIGLSRLSLSGLGFQYRPRGPGRAEIGD